MNRTFFISQYASLNSRASKIDGKEEDGDKREKRRTREPMEVQDGSIKLDVIVMDGGVEENNVGKRENGCCKENKML